MVKIEQREGEAGEKKVVEEVLRLCTYIRGERGWGEINESGLAMQAFCRHSTSRRRLAGQGPGRYIGLDGMDGPAGAGTTGRHGLWASCSCSYSSTCGSSSNKVAASKKRQSQVTSHPCSGQVRAEGGPRPPGRAGR